MRTGTILHPFPSLAPAIQRISADRAQGKADGTIIIYDIETNAVARKLKGHSRQVQSLSWSHNGRYLLSASLDWKAIIWDLKGGSRLRLARFNGPPYYAEIHPRNQWVGSLPITPS